MSDRDEVDSNPNHELIPDDSVLRRDVLAMLEHSDSPEIFERHLQMLSELSAAPKPPLISDAMLDAWAKDPLA